MTASYIRLYTVHLYTVPGVGRTYRALSRFDSQALPVFVETTCFTWHGYRSQSSDINHQWATLMNPNKSKTAVCGSPIFVCLMAGEAITGCPNRTSCPHGHGSILLTWSGGCEIQWLLPFITVSCVVCLHIFAICCLLYSPSCRVKTVPTLPVSQPHVYGISL